MDPQGSQPVLSADCVALFEGTGLIKPAANNKRKVSTALLSPPSSNPSRSSSEASSSSRISSGSFAATYEVEEVEEVEVPVTLRSVESYEFLGFTTETAQSLWVRYLKYSPEQDSSFFDYAASHIWAPGREDVTSDQDNWRGLMVALGINERLQSAIMLPGFDDVRFTASCKYWLMNAMKAQWQALENLDLEMRMEAARRQHVKTGRPKAGSISSPPSLVDAPAAIERHQMLWRGSDHLNNLNMYNSETCEINLDAIHAAPGDFSGANPIAYFSPHRETADRYCRYIKHAAHIAKVSIVQIAVPYSLMDGLSVEYLRSPAPPKYNKETNTWLYPPTCDWQRVIWWCRRGRNLPKELWWVTTKDVLIGETSHGKNCKYDTMEKPEEIDHRQVLEVKINGVETKSMQWAFQTLKGRFALQDTCRFKVWLHNAGALHVPRRKK
ncbi:MAG: hypothetical protein M1812_007246 [Candelaria pacifica]|nr:MAG: hypothetical protein M1812_007246 [Candelaria pacifica]